MLFHATKHGPTRSKYKGPFSMDGRERRSHARGVYPTQDPSCIGTVRMKEEEETDTRIMRESSKKSGRKKRGTKRKIPKKA